MTDRGRAPVDASFACPFVAFEDDRDARSDVPDPRHRCFAELRPAPRAIAHQQAYCLSSGFAACPTFSDWARREAARVRHEPSASSGAAAGLAAGTAAGLMAAGDAASAELGAGEPGAGPEESVWPRRSEREWASPPPWRDEQAEAVSEAAPPPFLADREEAPPPTDRPDQVPGPDEEVAPLAAGVAAGAAASSRREPWVLEEGAPDQEETAEPPMRRFTRPTGRGDARRTADPSRAGAGGAPAWETPRRFEAYPTIRAPRSLPNLSGIALAVAALIVGALALFFIPPFLLGLGGGGSSSTPTVSPTASVVAGSPSPDASQSAAPSAAQTTYIVKSGDTMTSIAKRFGVDVNALIAANPQVKDPNKLQIGQQLTIPTATSSGGGPSPSPSP